MGVLGARSTLPVLGLLLAAACVKQLPPLPPPAAVVPDVDTGAPPAEGQGRLVVDVVDGPRPVHRIDMRAAPLGQGPVGFRLSESPVLLCPASPCVADLPQGNVLLGFPVIGKSSLDVELVHVGAEPTVYRRSLSLYEDHTGATRVLGIIFTSVGASALVTGAVLLPVGLQQDSRDLTWAGGITLGAGALLTTLGIWAVRHDAPTYRPGSTNHFPLSVSP
ncbi:MAG TPA: hypothetical protein VL172_18835 [Kofleriaceae bacterium]|jgi:hypothetical protein|nr:hypothetical protein [Kofleriaceae bacterium]